MLVVDNCHIGSSSRSLEELREADIPLYIWGAGNVADEVCQLLDKYEIAVDGVFVTTAIGRGMKFRNYEVVTLEEALKRNILINVMIGHAQYHKKVELENIKGINKIYYILNPFRSHDNISFDYYVEHREEFEYSFTLFKEEYSKKVYQAYLNTRVNDDLHYLLECFEEPITYYNNGIFRLSETENYVDIGAYNGDTVMSFIGSVGGKYDHIYAFEPDEGLFQELKHNVNVNHYHDIELYQLGLWNSNGELSFAGESGQSDRVIVGADLVNKIGVVTLDSMLGDKQVSLIKCNMSAGTKEWIEGARRIIHEQKPKLIINVGLTKQLLYQIPALIYGMNDAYRFSLRFIESMPSRLFLFAY